jgi:hypothetical protein
MGKRTWLETAIATEYLPFLASLDDNEKGHAEAEQFNEVIRSAWAARNLSELSQQQSLMDTTRRAIKDHLGENHFSLNYIKFTTDEYILLNDAKQGRVAERNEQVQFLDDPDAIVVRAIALLNSPEWSEIAAGLSVLIGRRSSELLSTARFTKCSKWSVTFTGALKRRSETQILSIEIPTLAPADAVCKALAKVRFSLPEAVGLDAETVNSKYGQAVIRACDRYFTDLVPNREGKDNLYTHLNRAIYATIATFWYYPPSVNDVEFKAAIQGHYAIFDENNPEIKRSLTASRHYSDYEIADAVIAQYGGKRKGVKLGLDGVQVISEFQKQIEATTEKPKQKKKLSSVRIWREDKPLLEQIFEQLGLDESLNQSERMGELLLWVKEHLGDSQILDKTGQPSIIKTNYKTDRSTQQGCPVLSDLFPKDESTTSLPAPEAIETSQAIPEIPLLQSELSLDTATHDDEQNETTVAVSKPDLNAVNATQTLQPSSHSGLETKIDKLVDVMTQFVSFQMQSAIQPPTTPPTKAKVRATEEVKSTTITNEAAASKANSSDTITQQRSKRNSPEAGTAINNAIDSIIAHNNTTELHDLKWAISINAVKELVSDVTKSQRLVDKAIKERKTEIDAHHAKHQIELNHNHRHKRKRTINQVIKIN